MSESNMILKVAFLGGTVWAVRAGEGLLASVGPDVTAQVVIVPGTVTTKATNEHVPPSSGRWKLAPHG